MAYSDRLAELSRESFNLVSLELDNLITPGASSEVLSDGVSVHASTFWPCVDSIEYAPPKVAKFGGLGSFGEVVIKAKNFEWPYGNGTYFGRLFASNPYTLNRKITVASGFKTNPGDFSISTLSDSQDRVYFIKKVTGPDHNRNITIEGSDILSQLKESEIPTATRGNLNATLSAGVTGTINIGSNDGFSASGGYAIINDEIVAYSGISSTTSIVISSRGQGGTEDQEHDADAPVANIYHYSGNVVDCIREIIEDYSEIDHATYLPDSDWNTERDSFLLSDNVEVWITEPTPLDEVIDKLGKQTYVSIWWDEVEPEIKLKALGPTLTTSTAWNDDENILDDNIRYKRDQREIVTQVWLYYGKLDKSGSNDAENFEKLQITIDSDTETLLGQPKILKIYADYLPRTGSTTASKIATRIVSQNSDPIDLTLCVDAKDSGLNINDPVDITSDLIEGETGSPVTIKLRVIEKAQLSNSKYRYRLVYSGIEQGSQYARWAPTKTITTALTGASETSVVMDSAIPTDSPSTGTLYIQLNDGTFQTVSYTSYSGSTYTISSSNFSGNNASAGNMVLVPYDSSGDTAKLNYGWWADGEVVGPPTLENGTVGAAGDDPYLWI